MFLKSKSLIHCPPVSVAMQKPSLYIFKSSEVEIKPEEIYPSLTFSQQTRIDISPSHHNSQVPQNNFTSLIINQQVIPKLRNIKIELEYVTEFRDMIDLKREHIVVLSRILTKLQQLFPT